MNKISELSLQLKDVATVSQCIEYLSELQKELDDNKIKMIDKVLTRILLDNINKLDKYQDLLKNVFKSSITDFDAIEQQHFYRKYLKILYDKDELIILLKEAINMHQQFPQDIISLGKIFNFTLQYINFFIN